MNKNLCACMGYKPDLLSHIQNGIIMKRLTKGSDKKICGVCSGIAEYFNVDPVLVRLIWALLVVVGGTGILAYIVAAIIMPEADA